MAKCKRIKHHVKKTSHQIFVESVNEEMKDRLNNPYDYYPDIYREYYSRCPDLEEQEQKVWPWHRT